MQPNSCDNPIEVFFLSCQHSTELIRRFPLLSAICVGKSIEVGAHFHQPLMGERR